MSNPDTILIWLNYNSSKILDIVLASLRSIADLNYDNYLLLIVDNGSTDKSIDKIQQFVDQNPELRKKSKILKLNSNLGFTGAHNIAWRYILSKYPDARFLVLVNNDAVLHRESLRLLIELLEYMPRTCGVQGIIELRDTKLVDSFGFYMDELLNVHPFMRLRKLEEVPRKCFAVTYVTGAYSVYKINALKTIALRNGDLFPSQAFAYYDDVLLGISAYINGLNVVAVPVATAKHFVSLTFRILGTRNYFDLRSYIARTILHSTRYRPIPILYAIRTALKRAIFALRTSFREAKPIMRSIVDGIVLANRIKQAYGLKTRPEDVAKIPMLTINLRNALESLASYRSVTRMLIEYLEQDLAQRYGFKCV
ncbi:MAG: glycosyltransferase [Thermoprotei archaeon]